ncbi:MAG TPA: Hpt domain-containing protein, partial [Actinomycetota bacterium]
MDALYYFRIEANEHLEGLSAGLLKLERAPQDAETLKTLFRLAHTLKGSARMVSQEELGRLAHKMEDVLGALRDESGTVTEPVISAMLFALDVIRKMVAVLGQDQVVRPDIGPALGALEEALGVARAPDPAARVNRAPVAAPMPAEVDLEAAPAPPDPAAPSTAPAPAPPSPGPGVPAAPARALAAGAGGAMPADPGVLRVALGKIDQLANLAGELIVHRIRLGDHT